MYDYVIYDYGNDELDKHKGTDTSGLEAICNAKELFKKEKEEVERHQTLMNLTEANIVRTIKENVHYIWAEETTLLKAQKWLSIRKDCDKRRNYDEKTSYNFLTSQISEALELSNVEIKNITQCGYDTYAFSVRFTVNDFDYIFELEIPIIKNMTVENREYTCNGMLSFGYKQTKYSWDISWHSYSIKDFKEAIKEITISEKYQEHVSAKEV